MWGEVVEVDITENDYSSGRILVVYDSKEYINENRYISVNGENFDVTVQEIWRSKLEDKQIDKNLKSGSEDSMQNQRNRNVGNEKEEKVEDSWIEEKEDRGDCDEPEKEKMEGNTGCRNAGREQRLEDCDIRDDVREDVTQNVREGNEDHLGKEKLKISGHQSSKGKQKFLCSDEGEEESVMEEGSTDDRSKNSMPVIEGANQEEGWVKRCNLGKIDRKGGRLSKEERRKNKKEVIVMNGLVTIKNLKKDNSKGRKLYKKGK